ncbi:hypothetical protein L2E82_41299 [Cichorium intybus]|uniref:Uncharacterized protein n=1 Tax=Cichorium intybus TaxID=13427 RepID=A0ACB9AM61_CICIN|nr:hypothetical protein L2E82_41299 [Cichorium intybus]
MDSRLLAHFYPYAKKNLEPYLSLLGFLFLPSRDASVAKRESEIEKPWLLQGQAETEKRRGKKKLQGGVELHSSSKSLW